MIDPEAVPSGPGLSSAQSEAVRHDAREVVVSAAAGSGKTRVLVERFARAVTERGIAPDRIIAITYTQKAADELRERIERRLAADGRRLNAGREPAIGTIHGFCLRLLEENAIDAGLDPSFRVLQGDLYEGVLEEAAEEVLDEAMRTQGERFGPMFDYAPPEAIKQALISAYERARTLGKRAQARPAPNGRELKSRVDRWIEDLTAWKRGLPEKLADRLDRIPDRDGSWELWLETLPASLAPIRLNGRTRAHAEEAQGLAEELTALIALVADAAAAPYNALFVECLDRFAAAVAARKRSGSWVDLHDLMDGVIALLERPAFRARIKEDHAALLIDEYQDVNALQARLLDRLGADLEVFVVGDARQAIYGFRHAESEFFIRRLTAARAADHAVEIPENYRSRKGTVEWINALFDGGAPGAGFGRLTPCRRDPALPASSGDRPSVRLLWTVPAGGVKRDTADALRASDAEHAALEIRRMIDEGEERPGGIAILLRGMTALSAYEEALRRHRIPYHVMRGKGFYEKSEIVDLLNLFRTLRNPDEPLYAAALLRSPFVGLTDEDIWHLFRSGSGSSAADPSDGSLWTLGSRVAVAVRDERMSGARKALEHFWGWFGPLSAVRQELTLCQILERAVSGSAFEAVTLAQEDGMRRFANVRKFRDALREFESLYGPNLDAFVAQLESRMDARSDDEETEAPVAAERGDAVRIMTVHASKGLEFPTVVVGDLSNTAPRSRDEGVFVVDDEAKIVSRPPEPGEESGRVDTASFLEHRERRAQKDAEESLRLLYVAVTRARERLILCGSLPAKDRKAGASRSWMDVVLDAFPASATDFGRLGSADAVYEVRRRAVDETVAPSAAGPIKAGGVPVDDQETFAPDTEEAIRKVLAGLEDRSKPYRQSVDLTVSELAGVDERDAERGEGIEVPMLVFGSGGSEPEGGLLTAASAGHIFHEMLQHVRYDRDPGEERIRILKDFEHRMDAAAARRFGSELGSFLDSKLAADLRASERAGRPVYRELPFFYRARKDGRELGSVKGQVDLLFEAPDGKWTLVDYKTTLDQKEEHHRQIQIYVFCLRKLLKGRPHRASLYYSRSAALVPVDLSALEGDAFGSELIVRFERLSERILGEADGSEAVGYQAGEPSR